MPDKVTQAEIDKIKKEYEDREKKKGEAKAKKEAEEKEKEKDKDKDKKDEKEKKDEKGSSWFSGLSSLLTDSSSASTDTKTADSSKAAPASGSTSPAATPPVAGQHERYQLHRDFFNMRLDAWKKREAVKKAKELNLPMAPRGEIRGM